MDRASGVAPSRGSRTAGLNKSFFSTCANPRCGRGWLRLWRRRDTPVFEGGWCCSSECMAARVGAALAREIDGRGSPREGHRHRIPLGLVLLAAASAAKSAGGRRKTEGNRSCARSAQCGEAWNNPAAAQSNASSIQMSHAVQRANSRRRATTGRSRRDWDWRNRRQDMWGNRRAAPLPPRRPGRAAPAAPGAHA